MLTLTLDRHLTDNIFKILLNNLISNFFYMFLKLLVHTIIQIYLYPFNSALFQNHEFRTIILALDNSLVFILCNYDNLNVFNTY